MPLIYKDGKRIDLSDDELVAAVDSGEHSGAMINIVGKDGTTGSVPFNAKEVRARLSEGYRFETSGEVAAADRKKEFGTDTADELKAGALGLARGATFGGSDYALSALNKAAPSVFPSREELGAYQEENPTISTVGEVAGAVAPALFSGGASAGLSGMKAGGSLGGAIARGLPGLAERGAQLVTKGLGGDLAANIAARSLEGGLYGALSGADTAFLQGRDIQDEVISGMTAGAVLGGAVPIAGAILSAAGRGISGAAAQKFRGKSPKGADKIENVSRTEVRGMDDVQLGQYGFSADEVAAIRGSSPGSVLPPAIEAKIQSEIPVEHLRREAGWFGRTYAKVASHFSKVPEKEMLRMLGRGESGAQARLVAERADDFLDGVSRTIADTETGLNSLGRRVFETSRELKSEGMKHLVTAGWSDETASGASKLLSGMLDDMDKMIKAGRGEYDSAKITQLRRVIEAQKGRLDAIISGPKKSMSEVFMVLDNAKRNFGRATAALYKSTPEMMASAGGGGGLRQEIASITDVYERNYQVLRGFLEEGKTWGDLAAGAQRDINRSWTEHLGALKSHGDTNLYRTWEPVSGRHDSNFETQMRSDQGDIRAHLEKSSSPAGDLDQRRLMKIESTRNELIQKHIKHYDMTNTGMWGKDAVTRQEVEAIFGANAFKAGGRFAELAGKSVPETIQGIFEQHVGDIANGRTLRELGNIWKKAKVGPSGAPGGNMLDVLLNPGIGIGAVRTLDKLTQAPQAAARGMYSVISRSRGFMGLSTPLVPAVAGQQKRFDFSDEELKSFALDPDKRGGDVDEMDMSDLAPQTKRVLGVIHSKAPKPRKQFLLDELSGKDPELDPADLREWKKHVVDVVARPDGFIDKMEANALLPKHVDVFEAAYPALYPALVAQYKVWLQGIGKLPRSKRQQVSVFIREALDGRTNIGMAARNQALYLPPAPQQKQSTLTQGKAKAMSKNIALTETERVESA